MMQRLCLGMGLAAIAAVAVAGPAVAASGHPYRQPCEGSWATYDRTQGPARTTYELSGSLTCGYGVPQPRSSTLTLTYPNLTCLGAQGTAPQARGDMEIPAEAPGGVQQVWADVSVYGGAGAGAFELGFPFGAGAGAIEPVYGLVDTCPLAFSITAAFVYNALDGTNGDGG